MVSHMYIKPQPTKNTKDFNQNVKYGQGIVMALTHGFARVEIPYI